MQVPATPAPVAPADPLRHLYAHWSRNCASSVTWLLGDDYEAFFARRTLPVPLTMPQRIQRAEKYRKAAAYWHAKHVEANPQNPAATSEVTP